MELSELLHQKTNDSLKQLVSLLDGGEDVVRKDELVRCIHRAVMVPASLKALWQQLDDLSKKAVSLAYYNEGLFNEVAFVAQYGELPDRPQSRHYWQLDPILLDLLLFDNELPSDLMPLLADVVPPQDKFQLTGLGETPAIVLAPDGFETAFILAETERVGLHDVTAYLRLVNQGEVTTSSSSYRLTLGSAKKIINALLEGDYFTLPEKYRTAQTMRPFGLDVFARAAGWVDYHVGRGLHLTDAGREFYQTQNPGLMLEGFERWSQEGSFDELSRVTAIKGQKSKQTRLTAAASRREAVIEALSWCPADEWIDIRDFYRALKIWHFDFEVETTYYSNLYVGHKEYGMLYGETYWSVVKGLYINTVLWEYLGSIGALDLLYTKPEEANFDVDSDYLFYDQPYFSLYDGLKYFRINSLGKFLLGYVDAYHPSTPPPPALFAISPDLHVKIIETDYITPNDRYWLAQIAVPAGADHYILDTQRLLTLIESGQSWPQLLEFLTNGHGGPLPEAVLAWLDKLRHNSSLITVKEAGLFIRVHSPELADMILADPAIKKYCSRVNHRTVVIPANKEKQFRRRLKELDYILM